MTGWELDRGGGRVRGNRPYCSDIHIAIRIAVTKQ